MALTASNEQCISEIREQICSSAEAQAIGHSNRPVLKQLMAMVKNKGPLVMAMLCVDVQW